MGSVAEATEEQAELWRLRPYLFPPRAAEAAALHLNHGMRVLPHDNNTGAFFVALLRKAETGARVGVHEAAAPLMRPVDGGTPTAAAAAPAAVAAHAAEGGAVEAAAEAEAAAAVGAAACRCLRSAPSRRSGPFRASVARGSVRASARVAAAGLTKQRRR